MRLVALPAVFEIVPCRELGVTVGRAAICLCDVESDFPFGKRIENGLCEIGQTKPPLDVSDSDAQTARHVFLGFALIQGGAVTTAFIAGRHGLPDEVLGPTSCFWAPPRFVLTTHSENR